MCVAMHSMVTELSTRYLSEARRHFYVTPTSYLELISSYKDLLEKKQRAVQDLRNRYDVGLEKLVATEKSVAVMQDELTALQPELVKAGEETAAAMVVISSRRMRRRLRRKPRGSRRSRMTARRTWRRLCPC